MRTGQRVQQWNPNGMGGQAQHMLQARSLDGGKTWKKKTMLLAGVMPKLLRMSDGTVACAYGRPYNMISFSMDDGDSWGATTTISPPVGGTSGYMGIVEVQPGRLLAVFDSLGRSAAKIWLWEPPPPVNMIFGTFVDVHRRW
jgi:hypothetical protein